MSTPPFWAEVEANVVAVAVGLGIRVGVGLGVRVGVGLGVRVGVGLGLRVGVGLCVRVGVGLGVGVVDGDKDVRKAKDQNPTRTATNKARTATRIATRFTGTLLRRFNRYFPYGFRPANTKGPLPECTQ